MNLWMELAILMAYYKNGYSLSFISLTDWDFFKHQILKIFTYYNDFWRSCDTEDWSNDAENSALITEINYILWLT